MAESKPIPVRLSEDILERLDRVAERMGSNRAALIRFCTQTFLKHMETNGVRDLPPDWRQILEAMDGRTSRHQAIVAEAPVSYKTPKKRAKKQPSKE